MYALEGGRPGEPLLEGSRLHAALDHIQRVSERPVAEPGAGAREESLVKRRRGGVVVVLPGEVQLGHLVDYFRSTGEGQ